MYQLTSYGPGAQRKHITRDLGTVDKYEALLRAFDREQRHSEQPARKAASPSSPEQPSPPPLAGVFLARRAVEQGQGGYGRKHADKDAGGDE